MRRTIADGHRQQYRTSASRNRQLLRSSIGVFREQGDIVLRKIIYPMVSPRYVNDWTRGTTGHYVYRHRQFSRTLYTGFTSPRQSRNLLSVGTDRDLPSGSFERDEVPNYTEAVLAPCSSPSHVNGPRNPAVGAKMHLCSIFTLDHLWIFRDGKWAMKLGALPTAT